MRLSAGDKVAAATIIKRRKEEEKDAPAPNTEKEDRPKSVQNRTKTVKAVSAKKPKIEKTPKPEKKLVKKSQKS